MGRPLHSPVVYIVLADGPVQLAHRANSCRIVDYPSSSAHSKHFKLKAVINLDLENLIKEL